MGPAAIEQALRELFIGLDGEHFEMVASRLAPDIELADELTGGWVRGADAVGSYLRSQTGRVRDVRSRLSDVRLRPLAARHGLATFRLRQTYLLDRMPRAEESIGLAMFEQDDAGTPTLSLLHFGPVRL